MGHVGDKVGAEGFGAGQFLGHFVEVNPDLIKAIHAVEPGKPHRKIPLSDLFRRPDNLLDRAVHHHLAVDGVDDGAEQTQQHHIQKGEFGRLLNVLPGEFQPGNPGDFIEKQHHAAGDHKGHEQKENQVPPQRKQPLFGFWFLSLHFNTAL